MAQKYPSYLVLHNTHAGSDPQSDDQVLTEPFTPIAMGYSVTSKAVDVDFGDKISWTSDVQVPIEGVLGDGSRLVPIPAECLRTYPKGWVFNLKSTDRSAAANEVYVTLYGFKDRDAS